MLMSCEESNTSNMLYGIVSYFIFPPLQGNINYILCIVGFSKETGTASVGN